MGLQQSKVREGCAKLQGLCREESARERRGGNLQQQPGAQRGAGSGASGVCPQTGDKSGRWDLAEAAGSDRPVRVAGGTVRARHSPP